MKTNLFIARTPLQLFNCIEAKKRFHKGEQNILFYQYQRLVDKNQMESLIEVDEWNSIIVYPLNWQRRIFSYFYIRMIKNRYKNKIERCYIGVFNSIINVLINTIYPKKIVILDDGTKTLGIAKNMETQKINSRNSLFKTIRNRFFNTNRDYLYRASFFSIYPLDEYIINNEVVLNDYRVFKESLSNIPVADRIYFIGTNLNEKILKSDEVFEANLQKVIAFYKNKKMIYILHRYENIEYIANLAKKYKFDYVKFDNILEVEIAKAGFLPTEFATFGSSAIETLPLLYPNSEYRVFYLESKDILEHKQQVMEELYNSFERKGYEVIRSKML